MDMIVKKVVNDELWLEVCNLVGLILVFLRLGIKSVLIFIYYKVGRMILNDYVIWFQDLLKNDVE